MATNPTATMNTGLTTTAAVDSAATIPLEDPLDLTSSILYIVFDLILTLGPALTFWLYVTPVINTWTGNKNTMYVVSQYIMWISNLVLYAVPTVVGGFTYLFNAYVNAGYVAWTQYLIVWGGSVMQGINFILLLAGAITYRDVTDAGASNFDTNFVEFGIWCVVTAGIYAGYWVMNDNFLTYYVIEEINHRIYPGSDFVEATTV